MSNATPDFHFERLLQRYPDLVPCIADVKAAFNQLRECFSNGGKLLVCGNGGSAADAEHIVGELMKGFLLKRSLSEAQRATFVKAFPAQGAYLADHLQRGLPAIALTGHPSLSTAFANDVAADMVFAQQVFVYGTSKDVLLGISTSGNSKNVLNALRVAKVLGITTLGLTGEEGGAMREVCDVLIRVPARDTAEVQEYHLPVYHSLCSMLEAEFFG